MLLVGGNYHLTFNNFFTLTYVPQKKTSHNEGMKDTNHIMLN